VTIELCFREGGNLEAVQKVDDHEDDFILEKGIGKYIVENDGIEFGPGRMEHNKISDLDGEKYTVHFGTLRTSGKHVYLTGITPFKHTLTLK
jgi:hypothetical protein